VSKVKVSGESDPKQETLKMMLSTTTNTTKFHVRPEISLEDKVYPKTYYHHNQTNIEVDETPTKIQVQNL